MSPCRNLPCLLVAILASLASTALGALVPVAEDATAVANPRTGAATISPVSGRATTLSVTARETALVRFDLFNPGILPSSITPASLASAKLRLYVTGLKPAELTVHAIASDWTESVSAVTPAPIVYGDVLFTIPAEEVVGKHLITVDVTEAVRTALSTGGNDFGFAIQTATAGARVRLGSKEGPGAGEPATLEIETYGALGTLPTGATFSIFGSPVTNPASFQSAIGLTIGTNVQAYNANLSGIAALSTTPYGRSLLTQADPATARTTLGLELGADVQPYDADLASIAALSTTSYGRSLLTLADSATARTTLGLTIGADVQGYSSNLSDLASVATTDYGRSLLTQTGSADSLAALGTNGDVWIGAFMIGYGGDHTSVGFTRNLKDWTFINNGANVYTPPEGYVRDTELIYDPVHARFLMVYTRLIGPTDYHMFGIATSQDLITWTHLVDVPVLDSKTVWGPSAYTDAAGDLHVFVAASTLDVSNVGALLTDMSLYELHPLNPWDAEGAWSTPRRLVMPGTDHGWNEIRVQNTSAGIRMIVNGFAAAGNQIRIVQPADPNDLGGTWNQVAFLVEDHQREGPFFIERPGGGFRVFTTFALGNPNSYSYRDYSSSWVSQSDLAPCRRFPDFEMENGAPMYLTGPRAAAFGDQTVSGNMAEQSSSAVSITGGTLSLNSQIKARGNDGNWDSAGYAWLDNNGSTQARFVLGQNNSFILRPPSSGFQIYNAAGNLQRFWFQDDGSLVAANTISGTQFRAKADLGWGNGGIRFYDGLGLPSAFLGCFASNQFGMRLGTDGNGLAIYSGDGSTLVAKISNPGGVEATSLKVGGTAGTSGTTITGIRSATAMLDFAPVAGGGGTQDLTVAVVGAAVGDAVTLGLPAAPPAGVIYQAWVSSADTVTIRATNLTASPIDPAGATFRAMVTSF